MTEPTGDASEQEHQPESGVSDQALMLARDLARTRARDRVDRDEEETRPKLVMADDDNSLRLLVRTVLSGEGYEVVEAPNGLEALAAIRQHEPRLVLLDVEMPGLGGLDLCRIIKSDSTLQNTWVIMLTALAQPKDRAKGYEAGADAYLTKPFSPLQLLAIVEAGMRPR